MIYEILDDKGEVTNRIIAEPVFVEEKYPGKYRDVTPEPAIESIVPVKTLEEKLDELIAKVEAIKVTVDLTKEEVTKLTKP